MNKPKVSHFIMPTLLVKLPFIVILLCPDKAHTKTIYIDLIDSYYNIPHHSCSYLCINRHIQNHIWDFLTTSAILYLIQNVFKCSLCGIPHVHRIFSLLGMTLMHNSAHYYIKLDKYTVALQLLGTSC